MSTKAPVGADNPTNEVDEVEDVEDAEVDTDESENAEVDENDDDKDWKAIARKHESRVKSRDKLVDSLRAQVKNLNEKLSATAPAEPTEADLLKAQIAELEQRNKKTSIEAVATKALSENGLDVRFAKFLTPLIQSEEEVDLIVEEFSDAVETLIDQKNAPRPPQPNRREGSGGTQPKGSSMVDQMNELLGIK